MVKKGSRRGLNTGNTIRNYRHNPALRQYQKYGCLVVTESTNKSPASNTIMQDIHARLPSSGPGVELSINKRSRWTVPSQLQQKVYAEHGSENVKITVMEHTMYSPQLVGIEELLTCDTYCSNRADIPDVVSKSEMTIQQALQGHREEDHLSKLERRAFKKAKRDGQLPIEDTPDADEPEIPMYIFNIAYGAPTDGKLYKELATKGFAKNVRKNKNQISGSSKKFLKNDQLAEFEEGMYYSHQEEEFDEHDDDEGYDNSAQENPKSARQLQTVNLLDFARPKVNKTSPKKRPFNHPDPDERKSKLYIDKPEMLSKHTKTSNMNNIATTTAYIPTHTEVILKKSEMSAENLIHQFGDYFSEAFSTPRIVTLNLTKELRLRDEQKKFYLVLAHQAEGTETDVYRVYCTGSAVTCAKSKIEDLVDGYSYDLETILYFTLHHALHNIFKGEPFRFSKKATSDLGSYVRPWNVRSSKLADLTEQTVSSFKITTPQNIEESAVVNPKTIHRSVSWNELCGICFDDLNEDSPHSALLPCQHYFCNQCWSVHITSAIREGAVSITCPEYECNKPVDPVFIMAMVEFRIYTLYKSQLTEFSYFSKKKANWCPTDRCGRMYYCGDELADTDDPIPVSCLCGKECCFKCLNEPHWPLSCSQLPDYHRSLESVRGRYGFLAIEKLTLPVQVARTKICPWCSYPIEKFGGCDTMTCGRCLKPFCWKCGERFDRAHYEAAFCTEQMAKKTMYKDEIKVPNSGNRDLDEACRHRLYKSPYMKKQIDESTTRLIFNTGFKAAQCFLSMSLHDSLGRYLRQIQGQLLASHRLLEYCSAVNYFRPGSRICISRISTLDFSLTVLEEIIRAKKCDEKTIERLVRFYELAKSNTDNLMCEVSAAMNYVKPALDS